MEIYENITWGNVHVTPEKVVRFFRKIAGTYITLRNILYINTLQKHSFYVVITMLLPPKSYAIAMC